MLLFNKTLSHRSVGWSHTFPSVCKALGEHTLCTFFLFFGEYIGFVLFFFCIIYRFCIPEYYELETCTEMNCKNLDIALAEVLLRHENGSQALKNYILLGGYSLARVY